METFAVARNVEDLAAAKFTPMLPLKSNTLSRETFTSKIASRLASLTSSLGSGMVSLGPALWKTQTNAIFTVS